MRKKNYYAVRIGREGRKVYNNWTEAKAAVHRFPCGQVKGFYDIESALSWLNVIPIHQQDGDIKSAIPPQKGAESGGLPSTTTGFTPYISMLLKKYPTISHDLLSQHVQEQDNLFYFDTHGNTDSSLQPKRENIRREESLDTDGFAKALKLNSSQDTTTHVSHVASLHKSKKTTQTTKAELINLISEDGMRNPEKCSPVASGTADELPELTGEQSVVLERAELGTSLFFTGAAGSGKSILLKAIIRSLRACRKRTVRLAITASTGLAAVNIGGTTLHSFAGVGLGQDNVEELVKTLSDAAKTRWRETNVLIIDEISMIDGKFFDKLETMARIIRKNTEPFGGIQLIISGDFCQLPPVPDTINGIQMPVMFAFESEAWSRCLRSTFVLHKVHRQSDKTFVRILNNMRSGSSDPEDARILSSLNRPIPTDDGVEAAELYPLKREVENANAKRLRTLPGPLHVYESIDARGYNTEGKRVSESLLPRLLARLLAVRTLALKIGAQVMLIKNRNEIREDEARLVNGSIGKVIDFIDVTTASKLGLSFSYVGKEDQKASYLDMLKNSGMPYPLVRFDNGRLLHCVPETFPVVGLHGNWEAKRWQVPLILAWAMSVHKSQGQTLNKLRVDLKRTFEKGQVYVALSRVRSMEGLQILNFDQAKVMAHPRVLAWHYQLESQFIVKEFSSESVFKSFYEDEDDKSI